MLEEVSTLHEAFKKCVQEVYKLQEMCTWSTPGIQKKAVVIMIHFLFKVLDLKRIVV